jgi:1,4-dihydroxy-2-naphthoate octaprenyltransferase
VVSAAPASIPRIVLQWLKAARAMYTVTVLLPCCLGAVMAWHGGARFDVPLLLLILAGMMAANIGTNFTNDYFDWQSGVDRIDAGRRYKRGAEQLLDDPLAASGSVDGYALHFLSPRAILWSAIASFAVTVVIGIALSIGRDWRILPVGVLGVALGVFYTAPPVRFGYRGLGDLICFVGSGPLPVLGTFFLFTGTVTAGAVVASCIAGLLVDAILYIGNVPDAEADRRVGKTTLSTLLGRRAVRVLAPLYYGAVFTLLAAAAAARLFPAWTLLALLGVPAAARVLAITRRHWSDIPRFAPAIMLTVLTFGLTIVMLMLGFVLGRIAP